MGDVQNTDFELFVQRQDFCRFCAIGFRLAVEGFQEEVDPLVPVVWWIERPQRPDKGGLFGSQLRRKI